MQNPEETKCDIDSKPKVLDQNPYFSKSKTAFPLQKIKCLLSNKLNEKMILELDLLDANESFYPSQIFCQKLEYEYLFNCVFQVVLYRLRFLWSRLDLEEEEDADLATNAMMKISVIKGKILNQQNNPILRQYLLFLLLNGSRSFIENEDTFKKSSGNVVVLFGKNYDATTCELNQTDKGIVEKLNTKIIEITKTPRFKFFLQEFITYYGLSSSNEDLLIENLMKTIKSVIFMKNIEHYGMVGSITNIFINFDEMAKLILNNEYQKLENYYISTVFHECGHELIRLIQNDIFALTPRVFSNIDQQFESGYKFEILLFGAIIMIFDNENFIGDVGRWREIKLSEKNLSKELIKQYETEYAGQNFLRSGYSYIIRSMGYK